MFAVLGDFKIDVESEHRSGLKASKQKEGDDGGGCLGGKKAKNIQQEGFPSRHRPEY